MKTTIRIILHTCFCIVILLSFSLFKTNASYPHGLGWLNLLLLDSPGNTDPAYNVVSQENWSLIYVSSEETHRKNGQALNAFDSNPDTIWHTEYFYNQPPHPHEMQIDLGAIYELQKFLYLPRQDGGDTGRIGMYSLYLSLDGINWGYPATAGTFQNNIQEKGSSFSSRPARFLRIKTLSSIKRDPFASAAEFNLVGKSFSGNLPPTGIISTPSDNLKILTGSQVNFSGKGNDPDNNLPLTYFWNFGDPNIPNSTVETPGYVQFDHPGTYTVTFTVTDGLGRADALPPTRIIKVVDNFGDTLIAQTNWSLRFVDSEELEQKDGRGVNAFDGNPDTAWHTEYSNSLPPHPHEIQIDLGKAYSLDTLHYLPRQNNFSDGNIRDYAVYVSGNGVNWGYPVAMGSFANSASQKTVLFAPKTGRFIKLVSLSEVNGKAYASAAEINVEGVCHTPYVKLIRPMNKHVQGSPDLKVSAAVCLNHDIYPGYKVKFTLSNSTGMKKQVTLNGPPYEHTFTGLDSTEHMVDAFIVDQSGNAISGADTHDRSVQVGIGDHYVAIGDSITHGLGDDIWDDNQSQDGRNIEAGYTSILNNLLTASHGYPHNVANEGISGIKSVGGLAKLPDVIKRHPDADYYLVLYGTNDSSGTFPVPSGKGLNPGDSDYPGTFKDNMQQIIDTLVSAGKVPYLAKIPYTLAGTSRNNRIKDYNIVIEELILKNDINIIPPDLYSHFENNKDQLIDTLHPNGQGYQSIANLWHNALTE